MSFILVLAIIYLAFLQINNSLDAIIKNKLISYMNIYFYGEHINFLESEKKIIDRAITEYVDDITKPKKNIFPISSLIRKLKALYKIYNSIEELIEFLKKDYGKLLTNAKEENTKYFISFSEQGKYITVYFSWVKGVVKIVDASPTFKSLDEYTQYKKLLELLANFEENRKQEYNYSLALEEKNLDDDLSLQIEHDNEDNLQILIRRKDEFK